MAFYESANQGTSASSPTTEYYESFCKGDAASSPDNKYYKSVLGGGGEKELKSIRAKLPQEIIGQN